jgi:hypothetical protein
MLSCILESDTVRSLQEKEIFRQFIQALLWIKRTTEKPSPEVVNAVMRIIKVPTQT